MGKLPRSFYNQPAADLARALLGKVLVRRAANGVLKGRIVEDEAYRGQSDPGSHAYGGPTARNLVMFGPPGYLYVYRIYGVHFCINVVGEREGVAGAALIRALEPISGVDIMERNRPARSALELCNGPAKLCQAFGITIALNGTDLECDEIYIEDDGFAPESVAVSTRVGLTRGADLPLRFFLPANRFVSRWKSSSPLP